MKNLIIAVLATIIFYTQFCEVKMPIVMPVLVLMIWASITEVEIFFSGYIKSVKRGRYLQDKLTKAR